MGMSIFNQNIPQDLGFVDREDPEHVCDYEINMTSGKVRPAVLAIRPRIPASWRICFMEPRAPEVAII